MKDKLSILDYADLEYTNDQQHILLTIEDMIKRYVSKPFHKELRISGYAGTGKTTIAKNILEYAKDHGKFQDIITLTPTNKAVKVLKNKLNGFHSERVFTLHSFLYGSPDDKNKEELQWVLKANASNFLVIIDESSMIDKKIKEDLEECFDNSIVIYLGDGYQLEPVGEDSYVLKNPDLELTQVMRNAGDILNYSIKIREQNRVIKPTGFDSVPSVNFSTGFTGYVNSLKREEDSIFIVATNKRRVAINKRIREYLFKDKDLSKPLVGDRLISICNSESLTNGDTVIIDKVKIVNSIDVITKKGNIYYNTVDVIEEAIFCYINDIPTILLPDTLNSSVYHFTFNKALDYSDMFDFVGGDLIEFTPDGRYHQLSKKVSICTYGYAISAHKSQGSQWENVTVWQDLIFKGNSGARWLYTAITRAVKNLTIINN